jgi:hypothetical protein
MANEPKSVSSEVKKETETVPSPAGETKKEEDNEPAPKGNGGKTEKYIWTQTLEVLHSLHRM